MNWWDVGRLKAKRWWKGSEGGNWGDWYGMTGVHFVCMGVVGMGVVGIMQWVWVWWVWKDG